MKSDNKERKVYEQPEVVYEGKLSTRAGTLPSTKTDNSDPANLFGDQ